jgi:hypothetical protein
MRGEDGRGCVAYLYDDLESKHPQGGAVSLAICAALPANPAEFFQAIAEPDEFSRYWVSWDVYKTLYGLAV